MTKKILPQYTYPSGRGRGYGMILGSYLQNMHCTIFLDHYDKNKQNPEKNEFYAFLAVCRPKKHENDIWAMRYLRKSNIDHLRPVFWSQATPNCYERLWILKGSIVNQYSSSLGVFEVLQGIKSAENGPKLPEICPKSVLSHNWVLWRSQDIPNGYEWVI